MVVITYPCRGPGTLCQTALGVGAAEWGGHQRNAVSRLSAICRCFLQSYGHSALLASIQIWRWNRYVGNLFSAVIRSFGPPRLKRLYQIRRWNRDVGNLMNVTPAIQGYFSSNSSFRLSAVHPTAAQCRFGILSHLTGHYPARDGSATQSTWCYIRMYVPVNFLRISNANVKYKLVKSLYLLSVS